MVVTQSALPLAVDPLPRRQALAGVFQLGVYAPTPQLGDEQLDDVLERPRRRDVADVEPVEVGLPDPAHHVVGNGVRTPYAHGPEAANGRLLGDDPRRPLGHLLARRREGVEHAADLVRLGRVRRRDLLVDRDLGQVDARPPADQDQPADRRRVLLELLILGLRLLVGAAEDGRVGPEELDGPGVAALRLGELSDFMYFGT